MPQIRQQLAQAPRPLLPSMGRLLLEKYAPIADNEPHVTKHVRAIWQDILASKMRAQDYTAAAWKLESDTAKALQPAIKTFGQLVSLRLVDRSPEGSRRSYRYRLEFERNTMLVQFLFDKDGKMAGSRIEDLR